MSDKNEMFNKAFDLLLDEAAKEADKNLGEKLSNPSENICFSNRHENKMKKLFRREKNKIRFKKISKYSRRIACVLIACVTLSGITIFSVSAWRTKILNFVFESDQPNTDFNFGNNSGQMYSDDGISLGYVPVGFELEDKSSTKTRVYLLFSSGNKYFSFSSERTGDGNISMDTENATIEKLRINGEDAVYSSNKNVNALIWCDDRHSFDIVGNISKEEIIKIAEEIKK